MRNDNPKIAYRLGMASAVLVTLMLIWLSLGVGIIGRDGDPANMMYFGVVAVGIVGSIVARLRPAGMAHTLIAMAIVQALVAAIALIAKLGLPWSGPTEIVLLNAFFVAAFVGTASLFQRAHRLTAMRGSV